MRTDISTIFKSEITLPEVVQEKANLAFEEIKNKEHDNMKKITSSEGTPSTRSLFTQKITRAAAILLAVCVLVPATVTLAKKGFSLYERMNQINVDEWEYIYETYCQLPGHFTTHSRAFTEEETKRYEELLLEYETTNISPQFPIRIVKEKTEPTGDGLTMWFDEAQCVTIIELPPAPLSNEHLLEIIDFEQKTQHAYSVISDVEDLGGKTAWKKMEDLTIEEIERYYLIYYGASLDTQGGYRGRYLSGMEQKQYKELLAAYEAGTANPQGEVALIDTPEDFTGEHLAFCLSDENFYLPETPLTDEDILQIIDLEKKAQYSITILRHQWEAGLREHMPRRE